MSLDQVAEMRWVTEGINVPGGYSQMGDVAIAAIAAAADISKGGG